MAIDDRSSKNDADYRATPNKRMRCEACKAFVPDDACRNVKGAISAQGWCNLYESKREPLRLVKGAA